MKQLFKKKMTSAAAGLNGSPLDLDSYGSRLAEEKEFNKPLSIYEHPMFAFILTAFFILVDYVCLSVSWDTVQNESAFNITLMAVGTAVILDFPLAFSGYVFKRYSQGIASRQIAFIALICALALFLAAFAYQYDFRMATQSMTFSIGGGKSTMVSQIEDGQADEEVVELTEEEQRILDSAARFAGVLPLFTSVASFVFSYCTANPLGAEIYRHKKAIIKKEAHLVEIDQICEDLDGDERRIDVFICDDRPLLERKLAFEEAETLNNMVSSRRLQLMIAYGGKRGDLADIEDLEEALALVESARRIVDRHNALCGRFSGEGGGAAEDIQPLILPECFSSFDRSKTA